MPTTLEELVPGHWWISGQWLLVECGAIASAIPIARNTWYLQRQLRESVGREKDRVDWVWLVTDDKAPPAALEPALKQGPGAARG